MFVVECAKCGKASKAFVDHAGLRGKCPHCGKKTLIVAKEGVGPTDDMPSIAATGLRVSGRRQKAPRLPDTSPPALSSAVLAGLATWAFFESAGPWFSGSRLEGAWQILESCLWIGRIEVFAFLWGVLLLSWKACLWFLQRRHLRRQVFPDRFTVEARVKAWDVESCLAHIQGLSRRPRRSLLFNRVWLALEHLRRTVDLQEVRGVLTGQSAIDANLLDSSYTLLRFIIWVIPILGFIGTVVGIGIAVSQFADFIPKVSEMEKAMDSLRVGLGQVTTGLGTAFNTTLVALCLVAPLMLFASWLRKLEEHLLAQVDQFSNHQLMATLDDTP